MIAQAAILLVLAAGFVFWPLLRQAPSGPVLPGGPDQGAAPDTWDPEEIDLDVAGGRLSPEQAAQRRRESER